MDYEATMESLELNPFSLKTNKSFHHTILSFNSDYCENIDGQGALVISIFSFLSYSLRHTTLGRKRKKEKKKKKNAGDFVNKIDLVNSLQDRVFSNLKKKPMETLSFLFKNFKSN